MPSSRGPSWAKDWTLGSCGIATVGGFFTSELAGKTHYQVWAELNELMHVQYWYVLSTQDR